MEKTASLLQEYEYNILHNEFSDDVEKLLADELWEISADGSTHTRDEICHWLKKKPSDARWDIKNFDMKTLSDELALVTYWAKMLSPVVSDSKGTLHSSLWKKNSRKKWQMVFHQATKLDSSL
jgi:hypothetical protein